MKLQRESRMAVMDLSTLPNLRDLGGLAREAGGLTATGVLYRSALPAPGDVPPTSIAEWPPKTVVDLRSAHELAAHTNPLGLNETVLHHIPLMTDAQVAEPDQGARLADIYLGILSTAGTQLAKVLEVAAVCDGPFLLHCAAGKDRTGIAAALLLSIAGVARNEILADYIATNDHMGVVLARMNHFAPGTGEQYPNDRDVVGAVPEAIEGVLAHWDSHYGGVHGWARDQGVTEETMRLWNSRFIE
ncbi:putative protein-tyrosine-phosphatase [Rhodococcus erythropolis PR4]|uniref:Tyrosine-protein phosphatase n=2 Tax=Rhodococcus erythropolis TaxID=1833 RepID=C0ZQ41_RHOE4|nr:putative protein-tyrosine-phosphatase [Rhodococcus erythropolis PR4]